MVDVWLGGPVAAAGVEYVLDVAHWGSGVDSDVVAEDLRVAISDFD